jgi:MFS family permease
MVDGDFTDLDLCLGEAESGTEASSLPTVEDQINVIGVGKFHYTLMTFLGFLCAADGMEMVVLSLLSSQLQTEWNASKVEIGGLASVIFVGVLVGSLIGGAMGDQFGRRSTLLVGGFVFVVGGVASSLAPNLILLGLFRAFLGLGFGIFLPAAMCNFAELVPTKQRANFQLFLAGLAWAAGEVAVCLAAIVLHRYFNFPGWWRLLLFLCTVPGIIGLVIAYFYLPESPHYLSIQGRHSEVEALIMRIAETNGRANVLLHGGRIRRIAEEPDADWSWFQLFSKDLLFLTLAVSILWSICSFAYYGMTFAYPLVLEQRYQMDFEKQYWAVMLAAAAEIPGIFLAVYCVGHRVLGRRLSMAAFFLAAAVVSVLVCQFCRHLLLFVGSAYGR